TGAAGGPPAPAPALFTLVGGLYGLALGSAFMGESMFCRRDLAGTDASKVALIHLFHHLRRRGFTPRDSHIQTPHTQRAGAIETSGATHLKGLAAGSVQPRDWLPFDPEETIATLAPPTAR